MIVSAPAARAAMTLVSPRGPGPRTRTVSPGPVAGISTAQRNPAPSGLNMTAIAAGMSFRTRCTAADAGRAVAAADDALDRHAITDVDAPALRRPVADPFDDAERLVAG